ncbi:MAG: hypothetical protein GX604_02315 [Actinobacteria bacterium]|nr:hypothetical protein [Actinomycetota bacterium]
MPPTPPPVPPGRWQAPPPPPPRRSRTGLIVVIIAAVIVLAGGGTAAAILLTRDKDTSSTTTLTSSTTTTTSNDAIPNTTRIDRDAEPANTAVAQEAYEEALIELEHLLSTVDAYVATLGMEANETMPDIPQYIPDELKQMSEDLEQVSMNLLLQDLPPRYEEADYWIHDAAAAQLSRIDYDLQGILVIRQSGSVEAAEPYFAEARNQREYFQTAYNNYFDSLPE